MISPLSQIWSQSLVCTSTLCEERSSTLPIIIEKQPQPYRDMPARICPSAQNTLTAMRKRISPKDALVSNVVCVFYCVYSILGKLTVRLTSVPGFRVYLYTFTRISSHHVNNRISADRKRAAFTCQRSQHPPRRSSLWGWNYY